MVVKCKRCGTNIIVESGLYGVPILQCKVCGHRFFTNKIQEPALAPPPPISMRRQEVWMYLTLVIGFIFIIFGIYFAYTEGIGELSISAIGLFLVGIAIMVFLIDFHTYRSRRKAYEELMAASHHRLHDVAYQKELIVASDFSSCLMEQLNSYNRMHHIAQEFTDQSFADPEQRMSICDYN